MNAPEISDQQKLDEPSAPRANDDLTIAEHLRTWHRPGRGDGFETYDDGEHAPVRLPEHIAREFIERFGPLHPGNYREKFSRDWRDDFSALAGSD
jgi:hypothetical protein